MAVLRRRQETDWLGIVLAVLVQLAVLFQLANAWYVLSHTQAPQDVQELPRILVRPLDRPSHTG
jgi:uncharacterized membrane protein affecting hemolysin expression